MATSNLISYSPDLLLNRSGTQLKSCLGSAIVMNLCKLVVFYGERNWVLHGDRVKEAELLVESASIVQSATLGSNCAGGGGLLKRLF